MAAQNDDEELHVYHTPVCSTSMQCALVLIRRIIASKRNSLRVISCNSVNDTILRPFMGSSMTSVEH